MKRKPKGKVQNPSRISTGHLKERWTKEDEDQILALAKHSLKGLDESAVFVGILGDDKPLSAARIEFLIQLGHCVLNDKPIIIPCPIGVEIPKKLRAIADKIFYYDPHDPEGTLFKAGMTLALTEEGAKKH